MIKRQMILLDDDVSVRRNLVPFLQERFPSYIVKGAASVEEAKRTLEDGRKLGYVTRAVIVDEVLGKKDSALGKKDSGSTFLKYVQQKYPGARRIMLTAHATQVQLARAINAFGLHRCILKSQIDDNPGALYEAIRDALRTKESALYDAILSLLRQKVREGGEQVMLVAGSKLITPAELLQQIAEETPLGRRHMEAFTRFMYDAFQNPSEFMKQVTKTDRILRDGSKRQHKPKRTSIRRKSKQRNSKTGQ